VPEGLKCRGEAWGLPQCATGGSKESSRPIGFCACVRNGRGARGKSSGNVGRGKGKGRGCFEEASVVETVARRGSPSRNFKSASTSVSKGAWGNRAYWGVVQGAAERLG